MCHGLSTNERRRQFGTSAFFFPTLLEMWVWLKLIVCYTRWLSSRRKKFHWVVFLIFYTLNFILSPCFRVRLDFINQASMYKLHVFGWSIWNSVMHDSNGISPIDSLNLVEFNSSLSIIFPSFVSFSFYSFLFTTLLIRSKQALGSYDSSQNSTMR